MKTYAKIILIFVSFSLSAQNIKTLRSKTSQIKLELKKLKTQLEEQNNKEASIVTQLNLNKKKIETRTRLINSLAKERNVLRTDIEKLSTRNKVLKTQLEAQKKEYSKLIYSSYKSKRNQSKLMFLMSSENVQQAYRRYKYMGQLVDYRKKQTAEIRLKSQEILKNINNLKQKELQVKKALKEQQKQADLLEEEKEKQKILIAAIQKEKKKIVTAIQLKRKNQRDFERKIVEEITRLAEIERKRKVRLAAIERKKKEKARKEREHRLAKNRKKGEKTIAKSIVKEPKLPSRKASKTSGSKSLASSFYRNKNKLPWPVSGIVVERFGKQPYPGLSGVFTENNGVDISARKGASVKAVFKGKVTTIYAIPGGNKAVLIQHGSYYTLYHNLKSVNVKKNQNVTTGERIGTLYTDVQGKSILNFQVWKNTSKLNPSHWIVGM